MWSHNEAVLKSGMSGQKPARCRITQSKSQSNLLISFTNAFTLSIEFREIFNVFIMINPPLLLVK